MEGASQNPFGLSDLALAKIEFLVAGAVFVTWLQHFIQASQRLAVERERETRRIGDELAADFKARVDQRESEAREKFREDIAAGVRAAAEDE